MWRFLHPTTKKRDGEINSFFHARLKSSGDAEEIFLKTVEITRIFNSLGLLCIARRTQKPISNKTEDPRVGIKNVQK